MKACLISIDDMIGTDWSPTHAKKHREEVICLLGKLDEQFYELREREKQERANTKKRITAEHQEVKKAKDKAEKARLCAIQASEPKKPQVSCAKKPKLVDATNDIENLHYQYSPYWPHPGSKNISPSHLPIHPTFDTTPSQPLYALGVTPTIMTLPQPLP